MERNRYKIWGGSVFWLAGFALLSLAVHLQWLAAPDRQLAHWFFQHGTRPLDWVMNLVTALASPELSTLALLGIAFYFWRQSSRPAAVRVIGVFAAATLLEIVLKNLIYQPGPHGVHRALFADGFIQVPMPYAYPSGHTLRVMFMAGVMAQWIAPRAALFWWGLGGLVGISRVYLGVHWATDVLGGALLGLAAVALLQTSLGLPGVAGSRGRS